MAGALRLIRQAAVPVLILIAVVLLPRYMLPNPEVAAMLGEEAGPTLWPTTMLTLTGICALLWLVHVIWLNARASRTSAAPEAPEREPYNWKLAWAGIALTFIYGFAIQTMGFAWATLAFLVLWCLLGGIRRPLTLAPVAALGTLALIYVFVALAQMPLDRGRGVFTAATTELYDAIGIY